MGSIKDTLKTLTKTTGDWCIVRHVDPLNENSETHNFVLKNPGLRALMFRKEGSGFFCDEKTAKSIEDSNKNQFRIAEDIATPVEEITWKVTIYNRYDGDKETLYEGRDYDEALRNYGLGLAANVQNTSLEIEFQGKGPPTLKQKTRESINAWK